MPRSFQTGVVDWCDGRGSQGGLRGWKCFWGALKDLMQEKNEERYVMIKVRPEGWIDGLGSDITLNRRDMRGKFGYISIHFKNQGEMHIRIVKIKCLSRLSISRKS